MSHLFVNLPSFATDYSGAASVLYNLGGLVVIHEPSGCMGNFTGFDEPRWYHSPKRIFSSFIREDEAVIGDDSIIIEKILRECKRNRPSFIAILGTPVPALIGCDISGIAAEVTDATGITAFGLETNGFGYYHDGIENALIALEEHFMEGKTENMHGTVNILGYTPLDFFLSGDDEALRLFVASCGYRVLCFLSGDNLEGIRYAPNAEKNIVVSASAIPLAEKMKAKYKIPYCVGLPCGIYGEEKIRCFLQNTKPKIPTPSVCSGKALIIGEQVFANAVRDILIYEYGFSEVTNATFFGFSPQLAKSGDVTLSDELHLKKLVKNGVYDLVVGDPLFREFTTPGQRFISIPHPAVSSKLNWNSYVSILGRGFSGYISEHNAQNQT